MTPSTAWPANYNNAYTLDRYVSSVPALLCIICIFVPFVCPSVHVAIYRPVNTPFLLHFHPSRHPRYTALRTNWTAAVRLCVFSFVLFIGESRLMTVATELCMVIIVLSPFLSIEPFFLPTHHPALVLVVFYHYPNQFHCSLFFI